MSSKGSAIPSYLCNSGRDYPRRTNNDRNRVLEYLSEDKNLLGKSMRIFLFGRVNELTITATNGYVTHRPFVEKK